MKDKIHSLTIKGFQSHADTKITFDDGLNVIIGPTGSGKSGVIRAIEYILFNKLDDSNFITLGMNGFEGTIKFSSGKSITRIRNKKENVYILQNENEDTEPVIMTGFGEGPVETVLNFHGIKPIKIGKKDRFISVHSQHEQPFFLTETPGDKAKLIGSIAKTDIVDIAISDLALDIKRDQVRFNSITDSIRVQNEKIEMFGNIEDMKLDFEKSKRILSQLEELESKNTKLTSTSASIDTFIPQYKKLKIISDKKSSIESVSTMLDFLFSKKDEVTILTQSLNGIKADHEKIAQCQNVIDKIQQNDIIKYINMADYLAKSKDTIEKVISIRAKLDDYTLKIKRNEKLEKSSKEMLATSAMLETLDVKRKGLSEFISSSANLSNEIERFKKGTEIIKQRKEAVSLAEQEVLDEIKENPVCPTCGSDLTQRKEAVLSA